MPLGQGQPTNDYPDNVTDRIRSDWATLEEQLDADNPYQIVLSYEHFQSLTDAELDILLDLYR